MPARSHIPDAEDRDRAVNDVTSNLMVEAAAGTGKTTLLVGRILTLIRERKVSPDEIVAITFTERAAAELKARLQERLTAELTGAKGSDAEHLEHALKGLENMQVSTIHSFCTSILKERPVEAGVDPAFEVADDLRSSLIAERVWDEWIARRMDGDDPTLRQAVLAEITLDQMRGLAQAMCNHRDVLEFLPTPANADQAVEEFLHDLRRTMEDLAAVAQRCCIDHSDRAYLKIEDLHKCLREMDTAGPGGSRHAFILNHLTFPSPDRLGSKTRWSRGEALSEVRDGLRRLREAHSKLAADIAHNVLASLAARLRDYVDEYERAKKEEGLLDFHDLLIYACALLKKHPGVRAYFRNKYKCLLVDEFQDTDPLQAEIIFFLSEKEAGRAEDWRSTRLQAGRVFLVGDPKQSIYRFRRADIEMYASAKTKLGGPNQLTIHQNFRSVPSLLDAVNALFGQLIKAPEDGDYQPDYVPLHPGRDVSTVPPQHGMMLLYPPETAETPFDGADERRTYESRCIAAFIKQVVEKDRWEVWDKEMQCLRPVALKDIAILMRTGTGLVHLEDALRLYEIDYRVIGGKHFYERQEIQDLLSVLRAIDNPYDKVALVGALRSPFFGLSDEDLFLFHAEGGKLNYLTVGASGDWEEAPPGSASAPTSEADTGPSAKVRQAMSLLRYLHTIRNDVTAGTLLARLYEETSALVTYLLKPNGDQRVANLMKVSDTARALYDRGMCTLRGLVSWLSERQTEEAAESEAVTAETGDNFVRLLTIHKAKGLEFPVVILFDLAGSHNLSERFVVDRATGQIAIRTGSKAGGLKTRNFADLEDFEKKRSEAEERRLLYVAMTRARDSLVVPVYWGARSEIDSDGRPREGSLLGYLADFIPEPGMSDPSGRISIYDTTRLDLQPPRPPAFRLPFEAAEEARKMRAPATADESESALMKAIRAKSAEGRPLATATAAVEAEVAIASGRGREFGVLVHRLLEIVDWDKADRLEEIALAEASNLAYSSDLAAEAAVLTRRTLDSDLIRRILSSDRYIKEAPFAFKSGDTIVEGKIDVVFQESEAVSLVDFKTDRVTESDIEAKAQSYSHQTTAYARAVEAALGKPPAEVILFFLHLQRPIAIPWGQS